MKPRLLVVLFLLTGLAAACRVPSTTPTTAPVAETAQTAPLPGSSLSPASGSLTFSIVPAESEARFLIGEILAGSPTTVIGRTQDIQGELVVDLSDPSTVRLGPIQVDLSTLATDNSLRNRAIHSVILETGREEYRLATFVTTAVEGLPGEVIAGQEYSLRLQGDLSIHGVTRQVSVEARATQVSTSRLEGKASYTFLYPEFGVRIPYLPPQVASVEEKVTLEVDLVFERR